jgi:hypothetical protein
MQITSLLCVIHDSFKFGRRKCIHTGFSTPTIFYWHFYLSELHCWTLIVSYQYDCTIGCVFPP